MRVPADRALAVWKTHAHILLELAQGYPLADPEPYVTEGVRIIQAQKIILHMAVMDLPLVAGLALKNVGKPERRRTPKLQADHEAWGSW